MIDRTIVAYAYAVIGLGLLVAIAADIRVVLYALHIGW